MPQVNVIRWRDGEGWLVLSGGGDSGTESTVNVVDVETLALSRIQWGEPVAYIWAGGDIEVADKHLAALEDLGAPTGYLVDVLTEDDDTIRAQLTEAGMIVLGDGADVEVLRSGMVGVAVESMAEAFERGAVILGIGGGAAVLAEIVNGTRNSGGLGWLEGGMVIPHIENEAQAALLRQMLQDHPAAYALGIGTGSALALGPDGQVETWGNRQIVVTLGREAA